jgi:hypothetical protein
MEIGIGKIKGTTFLCITAVVSTFYRHTVGITTRSGRRRKCSPKTSSTVAVDYLRERDEAAVDRIGILGMSQGGHYAPLVAKLSRHVSFVVDVVGARSSGPG